ncbi:MAG: prolipoprotein diacylglyceryl transferase [Proteobacteria bacterium]|nr:prolipoprotein diacylglyceryl transferase [Pseudomonadota bacterium]
MLQIPDFDPVIVHIGPFALRWYAVAYVAGILLGWRYAASLLKNERVWGPKGPPMTSPQLDDLILWVTLGVILGGRLGYVLFYQPAMIWKTPLQILMIWDGGMSFHGGMIGVILAIIGFSLRNKVPMLGVGDLVAPCVPIGLFFGRLANFVNGELWGRPTGVPWGMIFCNHNIEATYHGCPVGARHPSQLYEAGLEGVALLLLLAWAVYRAGWLELRGRVVGLFLTGYGVARLVLENFREPDSFMPDFLRDHVTMGMLLSIPMIAVGLWLIWRSGRQPTDLPAA